MNHLIPNSENGKALSPLQQKIMNEIITHETHWMTRIFPSRLDKEKMKYQVEVYKLQADSDYTMIKMHREAIHQAFQEALETMLINGKVETRTKRTEFFVQQATTLEESIMTATSQFMKITQERLERLVQISHPLLLELEQHAIENSINLYYSSVNNMKNRFHNILVERVNPQ